MLRCLAWVPVRSPLHLCVTPQPEALLSNSCWEAKSEGTALCIGEDFHDYTEGAGDGAQGKAETSRTYLPRVREQFSTDRTARSPGSCLESLPYNQNS